MKEEVNRIVKTEYNIDISSVELSFSKACKKLNSQYGASYMLFTVTNKLTRKKFSLSTNPQWQKSYIEDNIIDRCPLFQQSNMILSKQKFLILPWECVQNTSNEHKEVCGIRKEHGIGSGVSLALDFDKDHRMYLGVAPDDKQEKRFTKVLQRDDLFALRTVFMSHVRAANLLIGSLF